MLSKRKADLESQHENRQESIEKYFQQKKQKNNFIADILLIVKLLQVALTFCNRDMHSTIYQSIIQSTCDLEISPPRALSTARAHNSRKNIKTKLASTFARKTHDLDAHKDLNRIRFDFKTKILQKKNSINLQDE